MSAVTRPDSRGSPSAGLGKAELGAGYLLVTALLLVGGLVTVLVAAVESPVVLGAGLVAGVVPVLAISILGVVALRADLSADFTWTVATWFAVGLGLASVAAVAVGLGWTGATSRTLAEFLVVTVIASGSVIGAMVGTVASLRRQHDELRRVNQRNSVMNRVLRHNIRNDLNVIQAHTDMLAAATPDDEPHTDVIERKTREVLSLSAAARDLAALDSGEGDTGPVDLGELVAGYVDVARTEHPEADITYDGPDSCPVATGAVVRAVLDNLVENAVAHHDGDPVIDIELESLGPETVELRVRDDGPGIPDDQFDVLFQDGEDRSRHGSGLGLWLVKWFVDRHDGDLHLEDNEPRGSVVCLRLPAAGAVA